MAAKDVLSRPLFVTQKAKPTEAWNETKAEESAGTPIRKQVKNSSLYMTEHDLKRLNILAARKGVRKNALILDAIDLLFAQEGLDPVTRWPTN